LYGYAIINGHLPCPTTTTNPANVNYGHADASCTITTNGVLPWKDLGVNEVDSWNNPRTLLTDPWMGYWVYRVDPAFKTAFTLSTLTSGNIIVQNSAGLGLTGAGGVGESAVAVVCTNGKNKLADGQNASFENANPVYQDDAQSKTFDDMCIWISRPSLFNRMVIAGKLP
jgi:hypothetical protein